MNERIRIWAAKQVDLKDQVTDGAAVKWFSGCALQFEIALGQTATLVRSLTGLSNIYVTVLSADKATKYMEAYSSTLNASLTADQWRNQTGQHVTIAFTSAETALSEGTYWLTVWGQNTSGDKVTFIAGEVTVVNDGADPGTAVSPIANTLRVGHFEMICPDDDSIHNVYLRLDQGQYMMEVDQSAI